MADLQNNTFSAFPSQLPPDLVSTPPDEVLTSLVDALRATVACPPSPAIAQLAEDTLKAVRRIQHGSHLSGISDFVAMRFRLAPGRPAIEIAQLSE